MTHRIEVGCRQGVSDAAGAAVRARIGHDLGIDLQRVSIIDVYTLDMALSAAELEALASSFADPLVQDSRVDAPLAADCDWLIEVGYLPGVTDNIGRTASEVAALQLQRPLAGSEKIYSSRQILLHGTVSADDVRLIADQILCNELIQRYVIMPGSAPRTRLPVPRVIASAEGTVEEIDLDLPDEALQQLSTRRLLALNLPEMQALRTYFTDPAVLARRRAAGLAGPATDVELESLAQTWSEHCKHKIFSARISYRDPGSGERRQIQGLYKTFIQGSTNEIRRRLGTDDWCVSVFKDNAGIIRWDDDHNLVFKAETHNSPSALDPYGGALTGIVGVNRDTMGTGKGAKLIFNTDVFCFAPPDFTAPLPPRILHPRRIFEGVRQGVEHGGNKSGVPTVNGSIVFDDRFLGKPLVYCGTGGLIPRIVCGQPSEDKTALPGDLIVMAGGRIGKDGIHGATFSSEELHEGSPVTAVQIGDPITQKRMYDFILIARDRGLFRCITDNGAGGLSSSVGEMAQFSGGCELDLSLAPLKYPGLQPWEILVSESQERMTFAVAPEHRQAFLELAVSMDVEATVLGSFTDSGSMTVLHDGRTVACLDMAFLHDGVPVMELEAQWEPPQHEEPCVTVTTDLTGDLLSLLGRLNICSKESVVRQYDHEVQGGSVVKPLCGACNDGPSDAGVVRPVLDSMRGVVVSHGICPRYSDIDTYHMMACAIDEAVRNYVCVGGSLAGAAGLDNFCWCDPVPSEKNPDGAYKLAQLVRANMALYDYTTAYMVPCISGKDSMKNDYVIDGRKISIPPTVLFSMIGPIADVRRAVTMDAKQAGDRVYVLGMTRPELGGSEYYALKGFVGTSVPRVDATGALALYRAMEQAVAAGLMRSCHDCSDGGLGVALAETAFAGDLGMTIDLRQAPVDGIDRSDTVLFAESQSRFVVTVAPERMEAFETAFDGCVVGCLGTVTAAPNFTVTGIDGRTVVDTTIQALKDAWQRPLGV